MSTFAAEFNANYKRLYPSRKLEVMSYKNRPFWAQLKKVDDFEGEVYNHVIYYEDPNGGSADFGTAQDQRSSNTRAARLLINRGREYQAIKISNEEVEASRSNAGALLKKKVRETDGVLNEMMRRMDIAAHGSGTGILASFTTPASLTGVSTITLDTAALGIRFSVGMYLQVATNNPTNGTAATLLSNGASARVSAISRTSFSSSGGSVITLDNTLSAAFPAIATSTTYYLLRKGDNLGFGSTASFGGVAGLKSWLPITAPTSGDNFWGFDRSVDPQRLAGQRYLAAAGEKFDDTFQNARAELVVQESDPGSVLVHPLDFAKYSRELGNRLRFDDVKVGETIFKSIKVGNMDVMEDPQVDPGTFYMLDMSTWELKHLGGLPHLDNSDGKSAQREALEDAFSMRWRAWYQPVCYYPGKNLVGQFAST
jgi:hypothetical protein